MSRASQKSCCFARVFTLSCKLATFRDMVRKPAKKCFQENQHSGSLSNYPFSSFINHQFPIFIHHPILTINLHFYFGILTSSIIYSQYIIFFSDPPPPSHTHTHRQGALKPQNETKAFSTANGYVYRG